MYWPLITWWVWFFGVLVHAIGLGAALRESYHLPDELEFFQSYSIAIVWALAWFIVTPAYGVYLMARR